MSRFLPFLNWLPETRQPGALRADFLAGLTGAVVVLPQGVAFASLAGMPPQYGLYTAIVPCVIAALFGSSRQMVSGPANAISLTTLALVAPLAAVGTPLYIELVLTLTFMVGILQLALAFSGLARWIDKVPHSVIVGFTTGAAVLIANSQIGNFFGIDLPRGGNVFNNLSNLATKFGSLHWPSTLIALQTLLACVVGRSIKSVIPYMLSAVLVGGFSYVLGHALWPEFFTLKTVSAISGAFPPLSAPTLKPDVLISLITPALVMTLLALTEAMSIARAYALRAKVELDTRQEMVGQGLANVAGAFFSSYPASGSFNRSGLNVEAGARTPLSATFSGLLLIVLLLFLGGLFKYLPLACISAILIMVAWTLIDFKYPRECWKNHRLDFWTWLLTFVLTVTVSLELAIVAGLAFWFIAARLTGHVAEDHGHGAD